MAQATRSPRPEPPTQSALVQADAPNVLPQPKPRRAKLIGCLLIVLLTGALLSLKQSWDAAQLREAYLPQLEARLRQDPENAQLCAVAGIRQTQAGHFQAATPLLQKAIGAHDTDPLLWRAWAQNEADAGNPSIALGVLAEGIRRGVTDLKPAAERCRQLGKEPSPTGIARAISPDDIYGLVIERYTGSYLDGLVAWWGRQHPSASGYATRAAWARVQPQDARAQRLWGEALALNGADAKAEVALKQALTLDANVPETHFDLAKLWLRRGLQPQARAAFARCLQLRPDFGPARLALQQLVAGQGGVKFVNVTAPASLRYRWTIAGRRPINILQGIGNGCAFLDYNNDGNLDILLVGPHLALYQGDGHGHFRDVTVATGLAKLSGHFLGCATGDYDNDGYEDIYISAYRGGALLHNEGGQRFRDVTATSGIAPQPWGTACAFGDVNGDGQLDLYIGNYVRFGPDTQPQLCKFGDQMGACGPAAYKPQRGVLYLNRGSGRFQDGTKAWGLDRVSGKNLGAAFIDYDGSGHQSLILTNDGVAEDLMRNDGHHFVNVGLAAGLAYDAQQHARGGMGVDWGDYDNDGKIDLAVATFRHELKSVARNDGTGLFSEKSETLGLGQAAFNSLTFGLKWLDYDNDGWLDLALANGHVQDNIAAISSGDTYRQTPQLFHNLAGKSLVDVSAQAGASFAQKIVGRGLAVGDYDNDGREDLLIVDSEGAPLLLHNETPVVGHWLEVQLVGLHTNRDALGAIVTVTAGGHTWVRRCATDGSYLSASDHRIHCGLGPAQQVTKISVRWPNGKTSQLFNVAPDHLITIKDDTAR